MFQWMHLNNVLETFSNELLIYDTIVKIRFDTNVIDLLNSKIYCENNTIYANSDKVFYSKAGDFVKYFTVFYHEVIFKTMNHWIHGKPLELSLKSLDAASGIDNIGIISCNENELSKWSWCSEPAFAWYVINSFDNVKAIPFNTRIFRGCKKKG